MIKPMIFNTEMVQAILDGRKTVTRRVIKPQPTKPRWNNIGWLGWDDGHGYRMRQPYQTDDILYVRETWAMTPDLFGEFEQPLYFADIPNADLEEAKAKHFRWKPSIHMPKEIARIFLRVKSVRVERLQNITEEQAIAEGCYHGPLFEGGEEDAVKARWSFMDIWKSTIKTEDEETYGWDANPWVWVIEFERCKKPEATP